jgi:putative flippase GtrA
MQHIISQRQMLRQFSRFLTVGVFNTVLGYAIIFFAMMVLKFSPELSNALGYAVGLVFSFVLSKRYTFRSTGNSVKELMRFLLVFVVAYATNFATLHVTLHVFLWHPVWCQIVAGIAYVVCSFWLNSRYVFKTKKTNIEAQQ